MLDAARLEAICDVGCNAEEEAEFRVSVCGYGFPWGFGFCWIYWIDTLHNFDLNTMDEEKHAVGWLKNN